MDCLKALKVNEEYKRIKCYRSCRTFETSHYTALRMGHSKPLFLYFRLFNSKPFIYKLYWWQDSNKGPLVSEETTLPTELQPLQCLHRFDACETLAFEPGIITQLWLVCTKTYVASRVKHLLQDLSLGRYRIINFFLFNVDRARFEPRTSHSLDTYLGTRHFSQPEDYICIFKRLIFV